MTLALALALAPAALCHELNPPTSPPAPTPTQMVDAANGFAFDLWRSSGVVEGNLACSPASIYLALLLAYAGAEGETAAELERVLRLTEAGSGLAFERDAALAAARTLMGNTDGVDGAPQLSIANSLWKQSGHPLLPEYLQRLQESLGPSLFEVDFRSDPEAARRTINAWVETATGGHIPDLLAESDVSPLTRLVLGTAVHFHATWADPFRPEATSPAPFRLPSGERVAVPTLHRIDHQRILEREDYQLLELAYYRKWGDDPGPRWSMLVLLPRESKDLAKLERELTPERLRGDYEALESRRVSISLPRFQVQSRLDLRSTLVRMGLESFFDPARCNLTGIDGGAGSLVFEKVLHEAEISVEESGTEGTAATAMIARCGSMARPPEPVLFHAERPFLFLIRNQDSGQILFTGRVADPR